MEATVEGLEEQGCHLEKPMGWMDNMFREQKPLKERQKEIEFSSLKKRQFWGDQQASNI